MTVQALLGDPAPPLSGPMVPHRRCEGLQAGRLGVPGQASPLLPLPAVPWSPSRVSGPPRSLTGRASSSKVGVAGLGGGSGLGLSQSACDSDLAPRPGPRLEPQHPLPRGEALASAVPGARIQGCGGPGHGGAELPPGPAAPPPHAPCPHGCSSDFAGRCSGPAPRSPPSGGVSPEGGGTVLDQVGSVGLGRGVRLCPPCTLV